MFPLQQQKKAIIQINYLRIPHRELAQNFYKGSTSNFTYRRFDFMFIHTALRCFLTSPAWQRVPSQGNKKA